MIRFIRNGKRLFIGIEVSELGLPASDVPDDEKVIWFSHDVSGETIAAAALLSTIEKAVGKRIEDVRRESYEQGARDRAKKATQFADSLHLGFWRNGCFE